MANTTTTSPSDTKERRKKLEFQMLRTSLESDKKAVESFLEDTVCAPLMAKIEEIIQTLVERAKEIQQKAGERTPQEHYELRNIQVLAKRIGTLKTCQYWQLLQLLYKFPNQHQIAVDDTLITFLKTSVHFKEVNRFIPADRYTQNVWSFKRFLTDCIAFARLRRLQIKYMEETSPGQSPLDKAMLLEQEFAIIPDGILLERKLSSQDYVHTYKGMDLAKNVPVVVKYLQDEAAPVPSRVRTMSYQEAKRRFEREAKAFEKLERHRQAKEQAAMILAEQARRQIEEGERKGNQEKIKAGRAMQRQGEELLCDRYFVKAYCLATGDLFHFHVGENGFYRESSQSVAFMVMEYIEGTDLQNLLQEYRSKNLMVPMKVFIPIMEGVLEALEYCHTEGIIHRDIRPENILITPNFKVRLTNLGRAKVEEMTQLTSQGAFVGTPGYAAPEGIISSMPPDQIAARKSLIAATDHRFDIYSLGCVAYEILTGRPPFTSNKKNLEEQDAELLYKHVNENPVPPAQIRKDIPETISLLVLKMLAKKPDHRFSNAREALLTLRATLSFVDRAGGATQRLLERLRPPVPETAYPEKKSSFLGKVAAFLIIVALISAPFIYMFRVEVDQFLQKSHQYIKAEWHEFSRKDKEECNQARAILADLEPQYNELNQQWTDGKNNFTIIQQDFSPRDGYLPYDEIIPDLLDQSGKEIEAIAANINKTKGLLPTDGVAALEVAKPYRNYKQEHPTLWLLVTRLNKKINEVKSYNEKIRQERKFREDVLTKAYDVRSTLLQAQEKLILVSERVQIRETQYPSNDSEYEDTPKEIIARMENHRNQVQKLSEYVITINELLQKDDLNKLDTTLKSYSATNFETTALAQLQDDAEKMDFILSRCKQKQTDKEFAAKVYSASVRLDQWIFAINEQQKNTKESWTKSQTIVKPAPLVPALFTTAEAEYKKHFELKKQLETYQKENSIEQAIKMADSILASKEPTVIEELQTLQRKLEGQIEVALAAEKAKLEQQQNAARQKQISDWKAEAETQQLRLKKAIQECQTEITKLEQIYPQQAATSITAAKAALQKAIPKEQAIAKLLQDVQGLIAQQQLATAYQMLNSKQREWQALDSYTKVIQQHNNRLRQMYVAIEQSKETKIYEARCNRVLQNLQKYSQSLDIEVGGIETELASLKREFQPNDQYPQLDTKSINIIANGKKIRDSLKDVQRRAQSYITSKNYEKAWQELSRYEAKSPEGYTQFVNSLPSVRSQLILLRQNCKIYQGNVGDITKIRQYQNEIKIRRDNIVQYCQQIEAKWRELAQYSIAPEKKYQDIIVKARQEEIPDLEKVLEYSNRLVSTGNYPQAVKTLSSFSVSVEPTSNFIANALESYLAQCERNLDKLKRGIMPVQPTAAPKDEFEETALKNAPSWYNEILAVKSEYDTLTPAMERCSKSTASNYKMKTIANSWREISEYPANIAELMRFEQTIIKKKGTVPRDETTLRGQKVSKYLDTNPRRVEMDITKELAIIRNEIGELQAQVKSGYLEEDTIRTIEYTLRDINRRFENDTTYGPARDYLTTLAGQASER